MRVDRQVYFMQRQIMNSSEGDGLEQLDSCGGECTPHGQALVGPTDECSVQSEGETTESHLLMSSNNNGITG